MEDYAFENTFSEELYVLPPKNAIVITKPWTNLKDEEKTKLSEITEAIRAKINTKLAPESFRVVYEPTLDLSNWIERPPMLIYFGPPIKGLTHYEVIEAAGTKMVLSDSLDQLIGDEASKAKLWQALKQLFSS